MPRKHKSRNKKKAKRAEVVKFCRFTREELFEIDYREVGLLRRYVSSQGKINPRQRNGIAARYQRQLKTAVKRARYLALLPHVGQ